MFKLFKESAKNALIYGLGNVSQRIVGFILIPIYTKHLSVSDYGILGIIEITSLIFISILGFGLDKGFSRWYWDKEYRSAQKKIFFSVLLFLTSVSILFIVLLFFISEKISIILFDSTRYTYTLKIMGITSCLQLLSLLISTLLKLQGKPVLFSVTSLIRFAITLIFTIYFIVYLNKSIEGIYEAQLLGLISYLTFLSLYILSNIEIKFSVDIVKKILVYSIPLALTALSGVVFTVIDRYLIKYLIGPYEVGIYSLGYKISFTTRILVINSLQMAISPILYKMMNDTERNKYFYSKVMTYFSFIVTGFVLLLSLYANDVIQVMAKNADYWESANLVPILGLSLIFGMLKDSASIGLHLEKKTKVIAKTFVFATLVNVTLNLLLIPQLKSIGAAYSALFSQLFLFVLMYRYSQKVYFIPYEIKKVFTLLMTATIIFLFSYILDIYSLNSIFVKLVLFLIFPLILHLMNFYDKNELNKIKEIIGNSRR